MKITYLFSDIDGVLTDGTVSLDEEGHERKNICYRDLDAIGLGRRAGLEFIFITGEDTNLARSIATRFGVSQAVFGVKDKGHVLERLMQQLQLVTDEVCYVGDSARDIPAIRMAGLGVAPQDATHRVRNTADFVTKSCGGKGVLLELVEKIIEDNKETDD